MARAAAGARRCPQRFPRLCRAVGCAALRSQTCSLPNKATPPPSWQRSDAALPGAAAPGPQPCSSGSTGTAAGPSVPCCAVLFRASRGLWPFPERLLQAGSSRSGVRALPSPEPALQAFRPEERGQVSLRLLRLLAAPRASRAASVRGSAARQRPSGDGCRLCPGITAAGDAPSPCPDSPQQLRCLLTPSPGARGRNCCPQPHQSRARGWSPRVCAARHLLDVPRQDLPLLDRPSR